MYETEIVPLLKRHGASESNGPARTTVDSVFSRLLELESPEDVSRFGTSLDSDRAWQLLKEKLGKRFATSPDEGAIRVRLALYSVPVGPGRRLPDGPGTGGWRAYDVTHGLAAGAVLAIGQDSRGSLLFGTGRGVTRFDGEQWHTTAIPDSLHPAVRAICVDSAGGLWFGTKAGAAHYDPSRGAGDAAWKIVTGEDGLAPGAISSMAPGRDGSIWFGTRGGGISRYDGRTFQTFTTQDGLAHDVLHALYMDHDDKLWIGTRDGVSIFDPSAEGVSAWRTLRSDDGLADDTVQAVIQDRRGGRYWIGTVGGVSVYDPSAGPGEAVWKVYGKREGLGSDRVLSLLEDWDGNIWVGTARGGVSRFDGEGWATFSTNGGFLRHTTVQTIFQDREGDLWFGTNGGVDRYDGVVMKLFAGTDGPGISDLLGIFEDSSESLWVGSVRSGISRLSDGHWTSFGLEDGFSSHFLYSMTEDRSGDLWFNTGTGALRFDGERVDTFTREDGLPGDNLRISVEDRAGNLWFVAANKGVARYDGKSFTDFTSECGLAGGQDALAGSSTARATCGSAAAIA